MLPRRGDRQIAVHLRPSVAQFASNAMRRPFCWLSPCVPMYSTPFATAGDEAYWPPAGCRPECHSGWHVFPAVMHPTENAYTYRPLTKYAFVSVTAGDEWLLPSSCAVHTGLHDAPPVAQPVLDGRQRVRVDHVDEAVCH